MARMSVKEGRLVLPDGMSYRLLVLPARDNLMTPALVQKIKELVQAGATVLGPPPTASPSLADFPKGDEEVLRLAAEVWGDCDGKTVTEHSIGKGRVVWGQPLNTVLPQLQTPADFTASVKLNWIHRQVGDTDIYFVANESAAAVEAKMRFSSQRFRSGILWNPQTGEMSPVADYQKSEDGISLQLRLDASGSTFVVFNPKGKPFDPVTSFTRDGEPVVPLTRTPVIKIQKATYGVPGDASRTREVRAKVQAMTDRGENNFKVAKLAEGDDPAYNTVKTLEVAYTIDDQKFTLSGQDPEMINLTAASPATSRAAEVRCDSAGWLRMVASQAGPLRIKIRQRQNASDRNSRPCPHRGRSPVPGT